MIRSVCRQCGVTSMDGDPGDMHAGDCPVLAPAPPSALSGVSVSELRFIAEEIYPEKYGDEPNCYSRAASILRALAESMEGGKG